MEYLLALVVILVAIITPAVWKSKPGRKRHSAMSGAFAALDEVFHPAGKQASEQLAEQTQATKPLPSPEDKKL
jgi:hypothetical protein